MHVLAPSGGSAHFLFELRPEDSGDNTAATTSGAGDAGEPLGKLEIEWRGPMGEAGRLQTQQIMATAARIEMWRSPSRRRFPAATLARPLSLQVCGSQSRGDSDGASGTRRSRRVGGPLCGRPRGDDREGRRAAAWNRGGRSAGGVVGGLGAGGGGDSGGDCRAARSGDAAVAQGGGARRGGEVG